MQLRSIRGDTVDQICQQVYGRTAGVTERVLIASPGLADLGPSCRWNPDHRGRHLAKTRCCNFG